MAICDCGSYTRAAAQLYIAQPSMSQQIRALEDDVGARLLDRVPEGIRLTPAGKALLPEARAILAATERARAAVRSVVDGVAGELTVMSIRSVASNVLPTALSTWHSCNPEIALRLCDFNHRRLLEAAMAAGEGDVGIGPRPERWNGRVLSLGYEELVLVCRDIGDIAGAHEDLSLLGRCDWVLFEAGHGLTDVISRFCEKYAIEPRVAARSAQVEAALTLSLDGVGITMLPENVIPPDLRAGHTVRAGGGVFRELVAYTRGEPSARATRFFDVLTDMDLQLHRRIDVAGAAWVS